QLPSLARRGYRGCGLFRLLRFRFSQRTCPWRTQQREQPAVNAIVASYTPGQYQENGKTTDDRVNTDRTSQQEVHVHEHPEESGNTGQEAKDQANANGYFTECYHVRPKAGPRYYSILQEPGIPTLNREK